MGRTILTRPTASASVRGGLFAVAAVTRLVAAVTLPILDDEAYYWVWSRHLQWGYLDHPPAVALLVAASTQVLGHAPWALRVPSLLLAMATAGVVFRLTEDLFGPEAAWRSQWLFHAVPLFFAGGVLVSPDAPAIFLWAVATWAAWRALRGEGRAWWVVGLAVGLGLQSKYSVAFWVPSAALLALRQAGGRTPRLYAAAGLALLLFLPNLLWNAQHHWQAFRFVVERSSWVRAGYLGNLALSAGGVLLYLSPLLAVLLLVAPWRGSDPAHRFLQLFCLPTLLASVVAAVAGKFKPHYIAPVALLGVVALAAWDSPRANRWRVFAAVVGAMQSAALLGLAVSSPWHPAVLADQKGWDRVAQEILRLDLHPSTVLVTTTYQNAGQLSYALRERYPVAVLPGPHAFDQWSPLAGHAGSPALFVHDAASPPPGPYARWCRSPQRLPDLRVPEDARPLRTFVLVRCAALSLPSP